jgi:hypothetical protein
MLQILVWVGCVIIFALGYCGWQMEEIKALQKQAKHTTGVGFFFLMIVLAGILFVLSLVQGLAATNLLNR